MFLTCMLEMGPSIYGAYMMKRCDAWVFRGTHTPDPYAENGTSVCEACVIIRYDAWACRSTRTPGVYVRTGLEHLQGICGDEI